MHNNGRVTTLGKVRGKLPFDAVTTAGHWQHQHRRHPGFALHVIVIEFNPSIGFRIDARGGEQHSLEGEVRRLFSNGYFGRRLRRLRISILCSDARREERWLTTVSLVRSVAAG